MIKEMHHTGFVVKDIEKAVDFYQQGLGLEEQVRYERQGPGIDNVIGYKGACLKICLMSIGSHSLELIQYVNPRSEDRPTEERNVLGATHLALLVDDIHAMYARLAEKGGQVMNPPAELEPGRIACYLQDPDGNWIELLELS